MKTQSYKIKVTLENNSIKWLQRTAKKIKAEKNVNNYIFSRFSGVKKIEVRCYNSNTDRYYTNLTYNSVFEQWLKSHARVEAINDSGYEDLTGYGAKTSGKINHFYLGRSTGWIPIYLEILQNNSSGGGALRHEHRKLRAIY